jgi:hypothetical protein
MKSKLIAVAALLGAAVSLNAANVVLNYGSTNDGSIALMFADETGTLFDPSGTGLMALGYFGEIGSNTSFSDYLSDFTLVDETPFNGNAAFAGYLEVLNVPNFDNLPDVKPYIFIFSGIGDFANAGDATGFSIFTDSSWSNYPPQPDELAVADTLVLFASLEPDTIVVGDIAPAVVPPAPIGGFIITAAEVPEPSHFALAFGLLGLGLAVYRRKLRR